MSRELCRAISPRRSAGLGRPLAPLEFHFRNDSAIDWILSNVPVTGGGSIGTVLERGAYDREAQECSARARSACASSSALRVPAQAFGVFSVRDGKRKRPARQFCVGRSDATIPSMLRQINSVPRRSVCGPTSIKAQRRPTEADLEQLRQHLSLQIRRMAPDRGTVAAHCWSRG